MWNKQLAEESRLLGFANFEILTPETRQSKHALVFVFLLEIVFALKEFKLCRFATQDLHENLLRGIWLTPVSLFYVSFSDWITCSSMII